MGKFLMGVIQVDTQDNKKENLEKLGRYIDEAAAHGAKMVAMPEYVHFLGTRDGTFASAEPIPGPTSDFFCSKAKEHGIWLNCGSIGEAIPKEQKLYNTSLLINPMGEISARYEKIHLCDMDIKNRSSTRESDTYKAGNNIVVCDTDFCKVGLSICYDMRFPELYRIMALRGAKILFVPSYYSLLTGRDHWEVILRTRAIENQCYVVAPAQIGTKAGLQSYGRSMIINPWGTVLTTAEDREGMIYAEIDTDYIDVIRAQLRTFPNRRPEVYNWN